MKQLGAVFLVSAALFSQAALAQLSGDIFIRNMPCGQVQQVVQAQVAQKKTAADIAKAALAAGVEPGCLTTSMILAGIDPAVVIAAVIRADGDAVAVMNAALRAGVSATVVSSAALGAGVSQGLVASTIARAGEMGLMARGSGVTPGPGAPPSSGGGGTASRR